MKIRNKYIVFIFILLLLFSSCNRLDNNKLGIEKNKSNKDTIQIWCNFVDKAYAENFDYYIINSARKYCKKNNIPLEIIEFNPSILSYEDYILKRNLATINGNIIIFDDTSNLIDLAKYHADYTKLKVYDSLLEPYKNRFCIPIGRMLKSSYIYNDILDYYGIDIPERPVIIYSDYLVLKQELKKRGAKFELKADDFYETVKYYLYKNGLLYVSKQDEILKNNDKLKTTLKNLIYEMCEDIILYDDAKIDEFVQIDIPIRKGVESYDSNSGLNLKEKHPCDSMASSSSDSQWYHITDAGKTSGRTYIIDYFTLSIDKHPFYGKDHMYKSLKAPSFFMHEKITNERIYELADYILEESGCIFALKTPPQIVYTPILYTDNMFERVKIDENFEYTGRVNHEDHREIINSVYDVFVKDEIKSKEMADEYFTDIEIVRSIEALVYDTIREIAKKLSGGNISYNLSLNGFDKNDEEINNLVDKKINEFMKQLMVKLID